MSKEPLVLVVDLTAEQVAAVDGKTFQCHFIPGVGLKLYSVALPIPDTRCPVIVAGEQCGCEAGHEGKHYWGRGD